MSYEVCMFGTAVVSRCLAVLIFFLIIHGAVATVILYHLLFKVAPYWPSNSIWIYLSPVHSL